MIQGHASGHSLHGDAADRPLADASRPPFVGRTREVALLRTRLATARTGAASVVWISGESGIGKTALVRTFLDQATRPDAVSGALRVLWASGDETETGLPFGVVQQIDGQLEQPAGPAADELPYAAQGTVTTAAGHRVRSGPLAAGADLLASLGSWSEPTVLVLDDLQWCDQESAQSFLFVLRRLRAEPLLVIVASLPDLADRLGDGWRRLLDDATKVTAIRLAGLGPSDLGQMARMLGRGAIGGTLAERLYRHTDGHPLYARSLLEQQDLASLGTATSPLPAPSSLAALVGSRVGTLSERARSLLAAGAVLGTPFTLAIASEIGGVANPGSVLDELTSSGLVRVRPDAVIEFSHSLVHAAVYHGLASSQRQDLHSVAASHTSGGVALRHRVAATQGFDPGLAAELAVLASRDVDRGNYRLAAEHLEQASTFAVQPAVRDQLLQAAVSLLCLLGDSLAAERHRATVEACDESTARTMCLGLMAFAAGRLAEAARRLTAVVHGGADDVQENQRTRAAVTLAFVLLMHGDGTGSLAAADIAIAGSLSWERCVALAAAVVDLALLGRLDEATPRMAAVEASMASESGAVDLLGVSGLMKMFDGNLVGAVSDLQTVVRRARTGEPSRMLEFFLTNLAEAEYYLGQWDDAMLHVDLAITAAGDAAHLAALPQAHLVGTWICAARGRVDEATEHAAAAASSMDDGAPRMHLRLAAMARAALAEARGDPAGMLFELEKECAGSLGVEQAMDGFPTWRATAVSALVAAGPLPVAEAAVKAFENWPDNAHTRWQDDLVRWRGTLAWRAHDPARAERVYSAGLERSATPYDPLARARLHEGFGRLLLAHGNRRGAIVQFRAARSIFAQLRAVPSLNRCDASLVECGLPSRPDSRDPLSLTDAEVRVARRVADGLDNREVARQLFVSVKTVEYHLGHVYAKLGVQSRAQLVHAFRARVS